MRCIYRFFPQIQVKATGYPMNKEQLGAIFKKHDKNNDGELSWKEVEAAFRELGALWTWFTTERAFKHADADDNGSINMEELELLVVYAQQQGYSCS
jgi:Ca2+-binding EF-hand superfamily protein